jgi:hypothetical protein
MFPNREMVHYIRDTHPEGTRIRLISMDDPRPIPPGTCGTVRGVDGAGQIMVNWDNGSRLSLIYGEDQFLVIG